MLYPKRINSLTRLLGVVAVNFLLSRNKEDTVNDCLLSNDGMDLRIVLSYANVFHSHKFKENVARYDTRLNIKTVGTLAG